MKILHILDHSLPLHSGYTFRTAAILREQRRLGWETFHLTSPKHRSDEKLEESVDGLDFYRTPFRQPDIPAVGEWALMRALTRRLDDIARRLQPDVLHAHSPALNAIPAIRVGRRRGIPVVYEVRAFWEDAAVNHGTSREDGLRYRVTRSLETSALERADHITTICEGLRRDIIGRGIPETKVTVIPNAVDPAQFRAAEESDDRLREELGLAGRRVLGFIGSFYAYEGLDLLMDAYPLIHEQAPDVRVLLVGGGPQEADLKAKVERMGIRDRFIFAGRVPHDRVRSYYELMDLLVYPRVSIRLTELVTPLKPLEAMAQGRLLVASDVGGHRELIRDGETGWLFSAGDPRALADRVLSTLADRDHWEQVRAAGRRYVETERNWAASVAGYQEVYQQIVAAEESIGVV